ncbi:Na+/H+ antiporter NhaA [Rickettsiales endosymbiont of Trichoplax sp. H2]|uniref:Na+/H+ antiporter NhaA n=1 Tax=Rickettsiales endosymbiont of Trichoplax sp. H2 TaxID=2021221 RepID=UPI0012B2B1B5|nr:Na+/H+ antiporter NhaA [Rickettsiales endosymbiont of Trichoplax sp. H2]MSO13991.1 Na(+)/H(+) antiporter NhaA [Rickettsiales endosymbiont of Trichoplax sp. H2]
MIHQRLVNFALLFHQAVHKGLLLFSSTVLAIVIANSQFYDLYHHFIEQNLEISLGQNSFSLSVHAWVNEFLMAIFFLVVGMEIKREMIDGHLKSRSQRILPIVAACFGVIFPVLIYIALNYQDDIAMQAWAIPAATDIAFALGVFAVFGRRLPLTLRVFLTALAIIDDLIAVIIIALFYSGTLYLNYFLPIGLCLLILYLLNKSKISALGPYLIVGLFMWYFFLKSGIHSTISGVILGIFIPLKLSENNFPLKRLEKILAPYVEYMVLPLFAFSNSGICFKSINFDSLLHPVVIGITCGLVIGKTIGISFAVHILKALKIINLPENVEMRHYYYISILCGIGFTMSLFIGLIAFEHNATYLELAKIGIILGSLISTFFAIILMKIFK